MTGLPIQSTVSYREFGPKAANGGKAACGTVSSILKFYTEILKRLTTVKLSHAGSLSGFRYFQLPSQL